ncbi:MAG TPA: SGNH/GDSL hydrolase family protein [Tepidisphaeraceae bacterium]|nr:SGNH/GDSL hydrolase family protein [Tepidisphaeraceae bacterium]
MPKESPPITHMTGESLVLAHEEPGKLLLRNVDSRSVVVRSTYLAGDPKSVKYAPGQDYVIDAEIGTIARTAHSRIPDFSKNVLYGKKDFDHGNYPGYGNLPFTIFVDYDAADAIELTTPTDASPQLPKTTEKLRSGKPLKIIAYGDSITAGGEASSVELQFPSRWAQALQKRYPKSQITLENGATGGDSTENGLARLQEKVLSRHPDLVLIAFGMNDHNLISVGGVPIPKFKQNLKSIATQIREKTGAEVILLSTFPPNPDWHYGSHQMEKYAEATKQAAQELNAPYADVYDLWMKVQARKDPPSLLGNNINHPNDFGHWLYLQALESLRL